MSKRDDKAERIQAQAPSLRTEATRLIERGEIERAVTFLLDKLIDDSVDVRSQAVQALSAICTGGVALYQITPPLDPAQRELRAREAKNKVEQLAKGDVLAGLTGLLRDEDTHLRCTTANVMVHLDPVQALPLLISMLNDTNAEVRLCVLRILYENTFLDDGGDTLFTAEDFIPSIEQLATLMNDEGESVRQSAADLLRGIKAATEEGLVSDTSYLARYLGGEYIQVWNELFTLGTSVRTEPLYEDVLAVARETMRRAKYNCEAIVRRLGEQGYSFHYPDVAYVPSTPDIASRVDELEVRIGPIPISVRAWYEVVEEVYLSGDIPPQSSGYDRYYHYFDGRIAMEVTSTYLSLYGEKGPSGHIAGITVIDDEEINSGSFTGLSERLSKNWT